MSRGGRFRGWVCVVTGASSGIGRRVAADLASEGASVCAASRRADRLAELVAELGATRPGHSWVTCDVSNERDVRALAERVERAYGRCDALVNCAGYPGSGRFEGMGAVAGLESVMATNFFGAVRCTAALLPLLEAGSGAGVVNVASVAGRIAVPGSSAYTASKFALVGWTEAVRPELAPRGVRVSLVEPGFVPTEGFPQTALRAHPLLRHVLGEVADVSGAVLRALATGAPQIVVPAWYRAFVVGRALVPALYARALGRVGRQRPVV
jgi:uncharacterized protein